VRCTAITGLTEFRPLPIKVGVRDYFDDPKCSVREAFSKLEKVVGLKVACNVEWDLLWNALSASFPDKDTFVPNVAGVTEAWCDVFSSRLEDDEFTEWTEDMVGRIESAGAIKLQVQVSR
jgi:hypothetical protein